LADQKSLKNKLSKTFATLNLLTTFPHPVGGGRGEGDSLMEKVGLFFSLNKGANLT